MTDQNHREELISRIFPEDIPTPESLEEKYPARDLPNGAVVTRFAPSPTGFVHIGGIFTAKIAKNLARHSGGVFIIRIEDTDQTRQFEDFQEHFDEAFEYFDILPDEDEGHGSYGPYTQSERSEIYMTYVRHLVERGSAYPCFCTRESLSEQTEKQREAKVDLGYYGVWATCRNLDPAEALRKIEDGEEYVVRFRAEPQSEFVVFEDSIRGSMRLKDNINDFVILKSSASEPRLPTYHLAHAVDDHLMRVNLVLRGEEWLASVPIHLQLFDALGFERIPYAHISPLMKQDGDSRRKLSKRKDPEASVDFYMEQGYPADAVTIYLKGLANSNMLEMEAGECLAAPIRLDKMSKSGALLDMDKLNDVSANYIATLNAGQIRDQVGAWAEKYDAALSGILQDNWEFAAQVIDVDRYNNDKVRKDLSRWSEFSEVYGFFFTEMFDLIRDAGDERFGGLPGDAVRNVLREFETAFGEGLDGTAWFEIIKTVSAKAGFALNNKEYKQNPEAFNGKLSDATRIIRVAITGKSRGPGLHDICDALGKAEINRRLAPMLV